MAPDDVIAVQVEVGEEVESEEVVEVEGADGEVEEEDEVRAQRKEWDQIAEKHLKRKALSVDSSGDPSKRQRHEQGVYIYAMDTGEHPPPLIVSYAKSVAFDVAYEEVCGIMKCASGCIFEQGTKHSMKNMKLLQPGNYEFMVFPRRGGGFSFCPGAEEKGPPKFLSCRSWIVNDRVKPIIRIPAELVIDSACHLELVIPRRKALQLQLEEEKNASVLGWGDYRTDMIFYRPIQVCLLHEDGTTVYKRADLTPSSKAGEGPDEDDESLKAFAGLRGDAWGVGTSTVLSVDADFNKITPERKPNVPCETLMVKEFSPLERNRGVPHALLGIGGLQKLGLTIDFEKRILLPLIMSPIVSLFPMGV